MIKFSFLTFGLACACYAGTITNGDFETGDLTGWTAYTTSYTATGTNGDCPESACPSVTLFNTSGSGFSHAAQFSVGQATSGGAIGTDYEGGGIYQNVYLSAGTVALSLDWAVENTSTVAQNFNGGRFAILLNGVTIASANAGGMDVTTVRTGTLSATTAIATAGTYRLSVEITRPYTPASILSQYVDNVTANASTAAPEPASVGFASIGVVLIACYWRRRKASR